MNDKQIKALWGVLGAIVIPAVLKVELAFYDYGDPGAYAVNSLRILIDLTGHYFPTLSGIIFLSLFPLLFYIAALFRDQLKWLFRVEFLILVLNLFLVYLSWKGYESTVRHAYVSVLFFVQLACFVTFSPLAYIGAKFNITHVRYAAHLVFFLAITSDFPLLFFHRMKYLGIG